MKIRIKKKRVLRTKLPRQFVKGIRNVLAEAKAGELSPYRFGPKERTTAVARMRRFMESHPPILGIDTKALIEDGRELGSKDYERLTQLDALADAAKAAADRASEAIDEMMQFVAESNDRIDKMKKRE